LLLACQNSEVITPYRALKEVNEEMVAKQTCYVQQK